MNNKTIADYEASIRILKANIRLFYQGEQETYRVVATELRKLLCDGKNTLIPRVFEEVRFHKLHWTALLEECSSLANGLTILLPGQLKVDEFGQPRFQLLFAPLTRTNGFG